MPTAVRWRRVAPRCDEVPSPLLGRQSCHCLLTECDRTDFVRPSKGLPERITRLVRVASRVKHSVVGLQRAAHDEVNPGVHPLNTLFLDREGAKLLVLCAPYNAL